MIRYYFDQAIQFAHLHSILFVSIVIISLLAIFIFTILLINPKNQPKMAQKIKTQTNKQEPNINAQDIRAIAGDDIFITQLDMARAYIELGKMKMAKEALENVIRQGNHQQKTIAHELLATL